MDIFSSVRKLEMLFNKEGFKLFFVGGTVRDYLLNLALTDIDLCTDATPSDMSRFLPDGDFTFKEFGFVKAKFDNYNFDITTLRIEDGYKDFRHPRKIEFTNDLKLDSLRRDFTINALYMDTKFTVFDFVGGKQDLKNKVIKMIGNPNIRLREDPLRIIRALRFSLTYKLKIDESLDKAIHANIMLLDSINCEKIIQDIKKINNSSKEEIRKVFTNFNIQKYVDMIK